MAPSASQFASVMSALGIEQGTRVALYSGGNFYWAARVWWLLRVFGFDDAAILNGGWQRWSREARPTEAGQGRPQPPGDFAVPETRPLMASKQEVFDAIGDAAICTLNALPEQQHHGASHISNYARAGHIKGSVNVPSDDLLNPETNELLPAQELRRRFERADAFRGRVITYCGGGIAASADALALVMLGHRRCQTLRWVALGMGRRRELTNGSRVMPQGWAGRLARRRWPITSPPERPWMVSSGHTGGLYYVCVRLIRPNRKTTRSAEADRRGPCGHGGL